MPGHMDSRRTFLKSSVAAALAAAVPDSADAAKKSAVPDKPPVQPNIILYLSDQFRWDFVGANGHNGSTRTPNLDALASRGKNFTHAVTNQPVCAPSRSVLFTSRYATETGVWHNGLALGQSLPTLAGELRKAGYSANLIGKWHLAPNDAADGGGPGSVKPEFRGGFLDLWEGSNVIEFTTHPYEGTIWDRDGKEITYKDEYRVDFITDRAERFLRQKQTKPFFLFISQIEPHQQNDMHRPIGPKGSVERFANSTVPGDLRALPGTWQAQLPDYYGCIEAIDASVGRVRRILEEEHLADNTIFVFMSDHGCHFMTRNQEYKRSTHNSSLRVPLLDRRSGLSWRATDLRARRPHRPCAHPARSGRRSGAVRLEGPQSDASAQRSGGSPGLAEPTTYPDQRIDDGPCDPDQGLDLLCRRSVRLYERACGCYVS